MMRILLLSTLMVITSLAYGRKDPCIENQEFKNEFFRQIAVAEYYTLQIDSLIFLLESARSDTSASSMKWKDEYARLCRKRVTSKEFLNALEWLYIYTNVDYGNVLSWRVGYSSYEVFLADRSKWINWYNSHLCENLTLKK